MSDFIRTVKHSTYPHRDCVKVSLTTRKKRDNGRGKRKKRSTGRGVVDYDKSDRMLGAANEVEVIGNATTPMVVGTTANVSTISR